MTALIVVDVQRGFDDAAYWGPRNNAGCETNVGILIEGWRARELPIVFVRHDSAEVREPAGARRHRGIASRTS